MFFTSTNGAAHSGGGGVQDDEPVEERRPAFRVPRSPITIALIVINTGAFLAFAINQNSFVHLKVNALVRWGANLATLTLNGEPWRLITAMFLHDYLLILAINMYSLWNVGRGVEALFRRARFLLVYLLAGIGGGVAGIYYHPAVPGMSAAPAIFGLCGAYLGFLVRRRSEVGNAAVWAGCKSMLNMFVIYVILILTFPGIAYMSWVGGVVTGFFSGLVLAPNLHAPRRAGLVEIGAVLVIIGALVFAGDYSKFQASNPAAIAAAKLADMDVEKVDKVELNYSSGIPKSIVEKVAEELKLQDATSRPWTVLLTKTDEGYELGFMVKDGVWKNAESVAHFKKLGTAISARALPNQNVKVALYDVNQVSRKTMTLTTDF